MLAALMDGVLTGVLSAISTLSALIQHQVTREKGLKLAPCFNTALVEMFCTWNVYSHS